MLEGLNLKPPEAESQAGELPGGGSFQPALPGLLPLTAAPEAQAQSAENDPEPCPAIDTASEAAVEPQPEASALIDWKDALRADFEHWLATIDAMPDADSPESAGPESPDLYSFYEQLAAANVEARKANRRTAEAFSQWGDTVGRFEGDLRQLREYLSRLPTPSENQDALPRSACLSMVEVLDRMRRLAAAFDKPPEKPRWRWTNAGAWSSAWTTQRQGFEILVSHLEAFLKKEGVSRIEVLGKPFEPAVMVAVATETSPKHPPQTVLEEVAPGYYHHGALLRAAQVKVNLS